MGDFLELLAVRRGRLLEDLAKREDPEPRGAVKEIDKLLKNLLDN